MRRPPRTPGGLRRGAWVWFQSSPFPARHNTGFRGFLLVGSLVGRRYRIVPTGRLTQGGVPRCSCFLRQGFRQFANGSYQRRLVNRAKKDFTYIGSIREALRTFDAWGHGEVPRAQVPRVLPYGEKAILCHVGKGARWCLGGETRSGAQAENCVFPVRSREQGCSQRACSRPAA